MLSSGYPTKNGQLDEWLSKANVKQLTAITTMTNKYGTIEIRLVIFLAIIFQFQAQIQLQLQTYFVIVIVVILRDVKLDSQGLPGQTVVIELCFYNNTYYCKNLTVTSPRIDYKCSKIQAGAELCQAQVQLEVVVEFEVEVEACHYSSGG